MAPGISYDDSGSLASYFGVTCLALLLLPATYLTLKPSPRDPLKSYCHCSECRANAERLRDIKRRDRTRRLAWRVVPLTLAWIVFFYMGYTIYKAPRIAGEVVYNPFEILGLGTSSTEKEIKKHYKKLSLQFHPDKIRLSENQTQEDADSKFVELTKAYKSLTDEVTRENLAKYGNPDGPQQREDKIAIPKWVVEGKNSFWVLGAYGLLLGGGIPWIVGRWWFSQRQLTRDGILNPTAELFFHSLREDTDFISLIALLASAVEFQSVLGGKRKFSKKEKKDRQAKIEELEKVLESRKAELGVEEGIMMRRESKITTSTRVGRRAQAILWSHLLRVEPSDPELRSEILSVLRITPPLLSSLLSIALSHNWLETSLLCIQLQPSLVQALPAGSSPLAQLPGITSEKAVEVEITNKLEGKRWLEKWVKKEKAEGSETQLTEALDVAESWPRLEIVDAEFKVVGEKIVTPSAIVSLTYRCRYVYPETVRTKSIVPIASLPNGDSHSTSNGIKEGSVDQVEATVARKEGEEDTEKEGTFGTDVKEKVEEVKDIVLEKTEGVLTSGDKTAEKEKKIEVGRKGKVESREKEIPNGYAHAPHWPQLRKPHYYVLLGDSKLDKVIVQPLRITDIPFPKPDGTPSEPKEFTLQFQAPPQANLYSFVAHWCSDTFLGSDVTVPVMLKVEEPTEDVDSEDDISEPDEDTIAGQMAMMRGDKVKSSSGNVGENGDDDGESGSEDEYESSSDEEGPKRKRAINEDSETDSD